MMCLQGVMSRRLSVNAPLCSHGYDKPGTGNMNAISHLFRRCIIHAEAAMLEGSATLMGRQPSLAV